MALFGTDGPSSVTESLCSISSHGEEEEMNSPRPRKKRSSSTSRKKPGDGRLGSWLFDDLEGEEEEEEREELFESNVTCR